MTATLTRVTANLQLLLQKVEPFMDAHFPTVDYKVEIMSNQDTAVVAETFDGRVLERSRVWKWRRGGLLGWTKWEGRDK